MNVRFFLAGCFVFFLSCAPQEKESLDLQQQYANVLDISGIPQQQFELAPFGFSDLGAWHGYALPAKDSTTYYGGFTGPLSMKMRGQWLSKSLCQLQLIANGKPIDLSTAKVQQCYYPGKLSQQLILKNWKIELDLIFVSNRIALLQTQITNTDTKAKRIRWAWSGKLFPKGLRLSALEHGVQVNFADAEECFLLRTNQKMQVEIAKDQQSYQMISEKTTHLQASETFTITNLQSHYFNAQEKKSEKEALSLWYAQPQKLFSANKQRWNGYLQKVLKAKNPLLATASHKKLAVKCVETLLTNWRSPAGDLRHDGVFPSAAYQGFYGFWSWDSWKQAVALVRFFPRLAKSNVLSMFQYQDSLGMIADCVYFDPKENNWRDTKAPLESWAVLEIFKHTHDTAFVKTMYSKLLKYHKWWYQYRDNNKNGLCEYGSTDGTLIAAKWESGMDNAVRFDNTQLLQNNTLSWSMNQESVDLNAYLCAEKQQLRALANILGKQQEAKDFAVSAEQLKHRIQQAFWDEKTGFFYDRAITTGELLTVQQGTEGWSPLYTQLATAEQAKAIQQVMCDTNKFYTKMPLPTLSVQNPKFNPLNGYWRGPVWIDQAYFGIKGLERYGYTTLSDRLTKRLLNHAEGLLGTAPIRENYHPITGKGLNANHFSWSAAHYLLLLTDEEE